MVRFSSSGDSLNSLEQLFESLGDEPYGAAGMPPPEEVYWGYRASRAGDERAQRLLVRSNIRFAISQAKKYRGRGVPFEDLIQEGVIGLWRAARRFDPDVGVKFISYARWWVDQRFRKATAEQGSNVRIPLNVQNLVAEYWAHFHEYVDEGLSEERAYARALHEFDSKSERLRVRHALGAQHMTSFDAPIDEEGDDRSRYDIKDVGLPRADGKVWERADHEVIDNVIALAIDEDRISVRDRNILYLYYGLDDGEARTLEEIGDYLGISRERVRQVRDRALLRLRPYLEKSL